ncbi:MAG: cytochrome C oxidase subunit IV family protein [Acidobacteria bacterium]|jgi:cytochrome c oxidase subunit 4|nr:cytochrome C oxidase subunit IV family protein [Acidobacteriota bacterium]
MDDKDLRHQPDHNSDHHSEDENHIVALPLYMMVFGVLVVGTILTVAVAFVDLDHIFPGANTLVALSIAFFKMACVVLIFMHVRWSSRLIWLMAIAGFFWLAIMFAFTMQDYLTRSSGTFTG